MINETIQAIAYLIRDGSYGALAFYPGARRGGAKVARTCGAAARPLRRALSYRALEALLQRGQFLLKMREAIKATDRWAQIAPTPPRTGASEPSRVEAATPKRSEA